MLPVIRSDPSSRFALVSVCERWTPRSVASGRCDGREAHLLLALDLHHARIVDRDLNRTETQVAEGTHDFGNHLIQPALVRHRLFPIPEVGQGHGPPVYIFYPIRLLDYWPKKIRSRSSGLPYPGPPTQPAGARRPGWLNRGCARSRRARPS